MTTTYDLSHSIGGHAVPGSGRRERRNPSDTRDVVASAPEGSVEDVASAVAAARSAQPAWAAATPEYRSDVLDRAGALLAARSDELGALLAREEGKTIGEGKGEVGRAARVLRFFAGEALRASGTTLASTRPGVEVSTYREPVGVVGLITPWNFPIAIPVWKAAPALAFGNTVVMKPSELTPTLADILAQILAEAGAPAGVFNLVHGGGTAGAALAAHRGVDAISFTGSVPTGARVIAAAATRGARVQAEMGGKNPLVILDDADLAVAVAVATDGAFFASGQRCTASSRLIVTDGIHDRFVAALAERVAALRVGHALDPSTQIGPLASEAQLAKTLAAIDAARDEGATLHAGGTKPMTDTPGHYVTPAILTGTDESMRVNREEIFGPVASVIRVKDYEAALAIANNVEFGLSAGIATTSLKHAHHFRAASRAGMVMVNLPTAGVDYHAPFGGTKASSYGPREQGTAAIEFYSQIKTCYMAP